MSTNLLAHLAILCAAISYAFAGIFGPGFKARETSPMFTVTGQVKTAVIFLISIVILIKQL